MTEGQAMSKGEKTRQRIVAEAATLFNERGFEGGSMTDLMEATGLEIWQQRHLTSLGRPPLTCACMI